MPYTIDRECCENIDRYIADQEFVVRTLADLWANWTPADKRSWSELLRAHGLGTESVASGGVSTPVTQKAKCYQEVIDEIESNSAVNVTQAIQLLVIGGLGYWNPFADMDADDAWAQWMLARFAIEHGRAKWKLVKLQKIKELCKQH